MSSAVSILNHTNVYCILSLVEEHDDDDDDEDEEE